jgi:dUTP pyrophosphatase
MKVRLLSENAKIPTIAYKGDAGFDVYSPIELWIDPNKTKQIKLGIAIQIEEDEVAIMSERSGMAIKTGTTSIGNIIDSNYRGEISIILSVGDNGLQIDVGDKIGQIIVCKLGNREIEVVNELSESDRGEKAHNSSGK